MKLQNTAQTISGRCTGSLNASSRSATRVSPTQTTRGSIRSPPDFESLPSAFGPASASGRRTGQLQIAVLAHDTSTLPPRPGRRLLRRTPHTWRPYRPDYPQPVADYARELARKCLDCKPLVGIFEGDTLGKRSATGAPGPPPACAWSTPG